MAQESVACTLCGGSQPDQFLTSATFIVRRRARLSWPCPRPHARGVHEPPYYGGVHACPGFALCSLCDPFLGRVVLAWPRGPGSAPRAPLGHVVLATWPLPALPSESWPSGERTSARVRKAAFRRDEVCLPECERPPSGEWRSTFQRV
eukprot:273578-Chlamydomonas_euryale.AAC.2